MSRHKYSVNGKNIKHNAETVNLTVVTFFKKSVSENVCLVLKKNKNSIYCYIKFPSHSFLLLLLQGFPGAEFIRKAGSQGLGYSAN